MTAAALRRRWRAEKIVASQPLFVAKVQSWPCNSNLRGPLCQRLGFTVPGDENLFRSRRPKEVIPAQSKIAVTVVHAMRIQADVICPINQQLGDAVSGHSDCVAPVSALVNWQSPSAIVRAVSLVIVDPVNRVTRGRTLAHVCGKVLEGLPPLTNFNASAAVILERRPVLVPASVQHPHPLFIQAGPTRAMRCPLRSPYRSLFRTKAAARPATSISKVPCVDLFRIPAGANTEPFHISWRVASTRNNGPTSEFLADELKWFCHLPIVNSWLR